MIGRTWHGWTKPENADAYQHLLETTILPGIRRMSGYKGTYLLRRDAGEEVEFITLTLWESMEAIRAFAGLDGKTAIVPPEARKLLARFDESSRHYGATWNP